EAAENWKKSTAAWTPSRPESHRPSATGRVATCSTGRWPRGSWLVSCHRRPGSCRTAQGLARARRGPRRERLSLSPTLVATRAGSHRPGVLAAVGGLRPRPVVAPRRRPTPPAAPPRGRREAGAIFTRGRADRGLDNDRAGARRSRLAARARAVRQ